MFDHVDVGYLIFVTHDLSMSISHILQCGSL